MFFIVAILLNFAALTIQPMAASDVARVDIHKQKLRNEAPDALRALEQSSGELRGRLKILDQVNFDLLPEQVKQKARGTDGAPLPIGVHNKGELEVQFSVSGKYRKCEIFPTYRENQVDMPPIRARFHEKVAASGPRGNFTLVWPGKNSSPQVESFANNDTKQASLYSNNVQSFLRAAYALPFGRLADLLRNDAFEIDNVEQMNVAGNNCYIAKFRYVPVVPTPNVSKKESRPTELVGSFVLDPKIGWALRSWEYSSPGTTRSQAAQIEYRLIPGDVLEPSQVILISDKSLTRTCFVLDMTRGPVADSEFTLTHYGMPELDRPIADPEGRSLAPWLGGGALLMLAIAAFLWQRGRKGQGPVLASG